MTAHMNLPNIGIRRFSRLEVETEKNSGTGLIGKIHPAQSEEPMTEKNLPSVSIVVPTHRRNADLECCLEAVSRLDPGADEIVVVDSAPDGPGAHDVALRWGARYVRENRPGASRARNRGAREASSDIIAFTDDDAAPASNWLGMILPEFLDPSVALVAGQVIAPAIEPAVGHLYDLCGFSGQGNDRLVLDCHTPRWFEKTNFLPFGLALNLALRRSVLEHWRGFDERIGVGTPLPGHEEQRAFLDLIELGFRLVYAPGAYVRHPLHAKSAEELRRRSLVRMQATSAYITLLMVEEPRHRREVLTYIWNKLWQSSASRVVPGAEAASLHRRLLARLQGPGRYFRSRSIKPA
jgi:glycosyltransferase involved in cell wall biosynthesis